MELKNEPTVFRSHWQTPKRFPLIDGTPLQRAIATDADRHHPDNDDDELSLATDRSRRAARKRKRRPGWRGNADIETASDQTILQEGNIMHDTRPLMISDGTNDPLGLHKPGWRMASGGNEHDVQVRDNQREAIEDAHAEYLDHLTNAWKGRA
jgi:hypothetical protein